MSEERELRKKELLASLVSTDDKIAIGAIKSLRKEGDEVLLRQAVALIKPEVVDEVQAALRELLFDLTDITMMPVLLDLVEKSSDDLVKQILLAAVWNSRLDASEYLLRIIKVAISGSYMMQVECMTIIENFVVLPPDDEVEQAVGMIGEEMSMRNPDDFPVLQTIQKILLEDLLGAG